MGKWRLNGRMGYRDDNNVLVIHRTGDEVELTEEQEQRLRAGQPGSAFQKPGDEGDEPELVEVAVANEATKVAEDGSAPASAAGTRNRKVAPTRLPVAESEAKQADSDDGTVPEPVTTTESKAPAAKTAPAKK